MDDSEIEKVVEKTLDVRRKKLVHKFFHNPNNAESLCLVLGMIAVLACAALFLVWDNLDSVDDTELVDSLLEKMDCQSIKQVYKTSDLTYTQENQIKNHMLIQCL